MGPSLCPETVADRIDVHVLVSLGTGGLIPFRMMRLADEHFGLASVVGPTLGGQPAAALGQLRAAGGGSGASWQVRAIFGQ